MDSMHGSITGSSKRPTNWPHPPEREGGNDGNDASLCAPRSDSKPQAEDDRLRGMSQDGGYLGAPAALRELRTRRLLRLIQEQARDQTCAGNRASDRQVARARRELDVLLRRRRDVRSRLTISLPRVRGGSGWGSGGQRSLGLGGLDFDHLTESVHRLDRVVQRDRAVRRNELRDLQVVAAALGPD